MRVPAIAAALLAALPPSNGGVPESPAPRGVPLLVLERTDGGTRADGLAALRTAIYADGSVLATGPRPAFDRGQLDVAHVARLVELVRQARLTELPAVVESRSAWFDLGVASSTLRWSGAEPATVRIAADLRPGAEDRALAPHGFVEVLEFLESIPIRESTGVSDGGIVVEFTLEPWTERDVPPFGAIEGLEPRPWPEGLAAPHGGSVRAQGEAARALSEAARAGLPVTWDARSWRLRSRTLFPFESGSGASPRHDDLRPG